MRRLLLLGLLVASACGGGGTPTAPAPQPQVINLAGTVSVFGITQHDITTSRAGTMRVTLAWNGTVDLDLYLASAGCSTPTNCTLFATADGFVNPEVVTRTVTSGESFRLFVDNNSLTQSVNYTLTIRVE